MRQRDIKSFCVFLHVLCISLHMHNLVWLRVSGRMLYPRDTLDWTDTARTIMDDMMDLMGTLLLRLIFQLTFYHLWRELNSRDNNRGISPHQMRKVIHRVINDLIYMQSENNMK